MAEETYTVHIDGQWSLEDLYIFPRTYEQVYFAVYSLMPFDSSSFDELALTGLDDDYRNRIEHAYRAFPWQGGYSAVNFYNQLKYVIPRNDRPRIQSIQYHSPGWIELTLAVSVAFNIERIVKSICASLHTMNETYTDIVKGMTDRKLLRLKGRELELSKADLDYVQMSADRMARMIDVGDIKEMNRRTGHPYRTLKILLSLYRRFRTLVQYQDRGKANFKHDSRQ
jgi:hypothetical protein